MPRPRATVWVTLALCLICPDAVSAAQSLDQEVRTVTARQLPAAIRLYKWLHEHPELSGQERQTARRLSEELRAAGLEVHEGIGGHGIVALLRSAPPRGGRVVLYRADMDALPMTEATGLAYASTRSGVMHACGHDIHMATAVGALRALKALRNKWRGTVVFVGQPAEETGLGARAMLRDRRLRALLKKVGKPTVALAIHDTPELPAGEVDLCPGPVTAGVDSVEITIHGTGGHGARPHKTVDPIVIGAEIVMALQTIVSRRLRPGEHAVVTVGKFTSGSAPNIIPPNATLSLSLRSYSDATRKLLLESLRRITRGIASAHGAPRDPHVRVGNDYTPSGYNDPRWTQRLEAVFGQLLGTNRVKRHKPLAAGEDFAFFGKSLRIPAVQWRLGAVNRQAFRKMRGKGLPGLHTPKWAPDPEPTLRTGIMTATAAVLHALGALPSR